MSFEENLKRLENKMVEKYKRLPKAVGPALHKTKGYRDTLTQPFLNPPNIQSRGLFAPPINQTLREEIVGNPDMLPILQQKSEVYNIEKSQINFKIPELPREQRQQYLPRISYSHFTKRKTKMPSIGPKLSGKFFDLQVNHEMNMKTNRRNEIDLDRTPVSKSLKFAPIQHVKMSKNEKREFDKLSLRRDIQRNAENSYSKNRTRGKIMQDLGAASGQKQAIRSYKQLHNKHLFNKLPLFNEKKKLFKGVPAGRYFQGSTLEEVDSEFLKEQRLLNTPSKSIMRSRVSSIHKNNLNRPEILQLKDKFQEPALQPSLTAQWIPKKWMKPKQNQYTMRETRKGLTANLYELRRPAKQSRLSDFNRGKIKNNVITNTLHVNRNLLLNDRSLKMRDNIALELKIPNYLKPKRTAMGSKILLQKKQTDPFDRRLRMTTPSEFKTKAMPKPDLFVQRTDLYKNLYNQLKNKSSRFSDVGKQLRKKISPFLRVH